MMLNGHFTVEAGRTILRDGKPFAIVTRYTDPSTGKGPPPVDVDEFAYLASAAPAMLKAVGRAVEAIEELNTQYKHSTVRPDYDTTELRVALAQAQCK